MRSIFAGLLLVTAGIAAGTLGFMAGAIIALVVGVGVMVRAFTVPNPAGRHAQGPDQSGPGRPGYDGNVGVGEDGAVDSPGSEYGDGYRRAG